MCGVAPQVIAIAYEHDPRDAHVAEVAEARADAAARANRARGEPEGEHGTRPHEFLQSLRSEGVPMTVLHTVAPTPHPFCARTQL